MVKGIIGKKVGMTQLFDANGKVVPVTVIEATSKRQTLPPRRPCASSVWKMFPQ